MDRIMNFLDSNRIQILSTCENNMPISRPIGSAMMRDNKIWYCMNNDKPMYEQLINNPHVCICACASDFSWIRIYAKVIFTDDKSIKEIYLKRPGTRFKSVEDETFSIFYLSNIKAQIHKKGEITHIELP